LNFTCQFKEEASSAEEQLASNKIDAYTKKGVGQFICPTLTFFGKPHGSKKLIWDYS
jgi:lipopolysaccharide export system protein LptC